jgi:hypothetical protein
MSALGQKQTSHRSMPAGNIAASPTMRAEQGRAARERAKRNGSLLRREFQEITPTPTFKKPLKPPLLLFEFFVQSEPARCSWVLAHV